MTEYKIGRIEGELPHKFVVAGDSNALVFAADSQFKPTVISSFGEVRRPERSHEEIGERSDLSRILGGGEVYISKNIEGCLVLSGNSGQFGNVPSEVMEGFKGLLEAYQRLCPSVTKIRYNTDGSNLSYELERWVRKLYGR